jgi:hypothetical protein
LKQSKVAVIGVILVTGHQRLGDERYTQSAHTGQ